MKLFLLAASLLLATTTSAFQPIAPSMMARHQYSLSRLNMVTAASVEIESKAKRTREVSRPDDDDMLGQKQSQ